MERIYTTVIFGNGLGRAIDNDRFQLETGIRNAWNDLENGFWNQTQKNLVLRCTGGEDPPQSEEQLEKLHIISNACEQIHQFEGNQSVWLKDDGKQFVGAVRHFIGKTAASFHYSLDELADTYSRHEKFWKKLTDLANGTCHIATTNYDNLLYQHFIDSNVFTNYKLRDGFRGQNLTFSEENLVIYTNRFGQTGYYLHLHGSPLFYDDNGTPKKYLQGGLLDSFKTQTPQRRHVVLTHAKRKADVISSSALLSSYWQHLSFALQHSSKVVLFGCGGQDQHLNHFLQHWLRTNESTGKLYVIERQECGDQQRRDHWKKTFTSNNIVCDADVERALEYLPLPDILSVDWVF